MGERIPAAKALIGFNLNAQHRAKECFVIVDERGEEWVRTGGPACWRNAQMTNGACFSDWLKGGHDMTPEWVFSELMAFYGFANSLVAEEALRQFGKIEECAWTRAMIPPQTSKRVQWEMA
jgi:hypothetical protein